MGTGSAASVVSPSSYVGLSGVADVTSVVGVAVGEEVSGEGVLSSGELESMVVPGVDSG